MIDDGLILSASDALNDLAEAYVGQRDAETADVLFRQAAAIELRSANLQRCWGGPMNGQTGRQALFLELLAKANVSSITETGSYRGLTTAWFAEVYKGPVYSCELQPRYFYQAVHNTGGKNNIELTLSDSISFLSDLTLDDAASSRPLFYLDSHWEQSLPLRDEINVILTRFAHPIIVIDDFSVPGDDGYGWDDYGGGNALNLAYLRPYSGSDLVFYFPTLPSAEEDGARRGCCILARRTTPSLDDIDSLKGLPWEEWIATGVSGTSVSKSSTAKPAQGSSYSTRGDQSYPAQINKLKSELRAAYALTDKHMTIMQEQKEHIERSHVWTAEHLQIIANQSADVTRLEALNHDHQRIVQALKTELEALPALVGQPTR